MKFSECHICVYGTVSYGDIYPDVLEATHAEILMEAIVARVFQMGQREIIKNISGRTVNSEFLKHIHFHYFNRFDLYT